MKRKRNIVVPNLLVGNPEMPTLQRSISKSQGGWLVEYRIWPDNKWVKVYHGGNHDEAKNIYKQLGKLKGQVKSGLLKNPTHHFPRTDKGRKGEVKHKRLLEEVFPGMKKGRPRTPAYWKADLFSSSGFIDSIIGQGTKQSAMAEAAGFVGKSFNNTSIARVQLSGPYADLDAMEQDITEDEEPPQRLKPSSIIPLPRGLGELVPRKRGRPRKIQPIKVIDIDDISSELAAAHAPKRGRGRPRKHAISSHKYKPGQQVKLKFGKKHGYIKKLMPENGMYIIDFGEYTDIYGDSDLEGLRGRPRKTA